MVVTRGAQQKARQLQAEAAQAALTAATSTAVATPSDTPVPETPTPKGRAAARGRGAARGRATTKPRKGKEAVIEIPPRECDCGSGPDDASEYEDPTDAAASGASDSEYTVGESSTAVAQRRATAARGGRGRGRGRAAQTTPREASPKQAASLPAALLMPMASDMKLMIGCSAALSSALGDTGADSSPSGVNHTKRTFKRKKDGTKTKTELLEGDLTDEEEEEEKQQPAKKSKKGKGRKADKPPKELRPHELPEDHIDYSRYKRLFTCHPLLTKAWSSLPPPREPRKITQPPELRIKLLPFQQEGVHWMATQEKTEFSGGILADEMGMGKTLQTIGLMLVNRGKPTLVVCPTVALLQWKAEIEAATDALSVFVYYGDARKKLGGGEEGGDKGPSELANYDVVLTTYAVLESGFRRETQGFRLKGVLHHEDSLLHKIDWFRMVLDEAHNLKDRWSNTSRAAFDVSASRIWSLTGTPLHNRVGELFSLIRLTRSYPFCLYFCHSCACSSLYWEFAQSKYCSECGCKRLYHFSYWNMHILKPIQENPIRSTASRVGFKKLDKLLDNIMLRRTKVERAEDLGLPPRIVVTRRDKFSPEEEDLYVSLFSNYQREFETYTRHGTVLNNYANLFELITRMRLAANHPDLLRLKVDMKDRVGTDSADTLVCAICNEEAEDAIVAKCKHVFCRIDAQQYVGAADDAAAMRCPACFALFDIDLTQPEFVQLRGSRSGGGGGGGGGATLMETMMSTPSTSEYRRSIVNRIDMQQWRSSTKIEALVEELSRHRQGNANIKSIVFSQFVNFLDLIQWRLNRAGFSVCRLDGRMTPVQRDAVIRVFMTRPEYTVFLVSLKAGGVALNLTEASHVYLADCWWNPAVEVQAMDRIHRMGQYRPIKVTRIIIDNSIESRIVALQVKKQLLVNSTIGRDKKSLDRLSSQDMQFLFST
ncbi:DNA repair protein rad16 [Coemansia biformis]|uniref:DNA repair protein rad16 n=1 Tax=Coemansia biformis TaxID=1286918 RepID=A0A9W8CYL6_9FUNG|nr:DNA repair protein rad16 [Coemansia biformis]